MIHYSTHGAKKTTTTIEEQHKDIVMTYTSFYSISPLHYFTHLSCLVFDNNQYNLGNTMSSSPITSLILSCMLHIESKVLNSFQLILKQKKHVLLVCYM